MAVTVPKKFNEFLVTQNLKFTHHEQPDLDIKSYLYIGVGPYVTRLEICF